jgi:23S rRNA pseudouridine1911/1915/1917 synthase
MKEYNFIIDENLVGKRIDQFLAEFTDFSRSRIQSLIKLDKVFVNSKINSIANYITKIDDQIRIEIPPSVEAKIEPKEILLDILYEDEHLLVINKQAGLTVHPGIGNYSDTLVNALMHHCKNNLSGINGEQRPGIVHRLDRDTTGLMVVAKDDISHISLSRQIESRELKRIYKALVWGIIIPMSGSVTANIDRSKQDRTKMRIVKSGGKSATTHYKTIKIFKDSNISLVECQLETGRTHQIRVHMSHIKHSILGDQIYGNNSRKLYKYIDDSKIDILSNFKRQALHSCYISFIHPHSKELLEFQADLPEDLKQLVESL